MSTDTMNTDIAAEAAVEAAVAEFYAALNAMFTGNLAPMEAVWSHNDDVIYMGPAGGYRVGWQQVQADWAAQAALKMGGSVKAEQIHMTMDGNLAIVCNDVKGENFDPEGDPLPVLLRDSSLFRKEGKQWKLIGLHTDLLPFLM